ncbi:uncharacterized protein BO96DRAFT_351609 [Aspergillus niger CBS 101883]|uniref:uncharacterized protein n=1 Tax=Aspergillus lacticoffeatus (strain CBS 101883) TaxID=1450533 RepID=UPI000D7EC9F3|nr:uncharacterized protein BO96DRAFT_351609 [Aspergillus niger CBS 101883]PYH50824.1 hypothetical protein BO96DRAFT_351609 [Aspergillus niger CBS 101883]
MVDGAELSYFAPLSPPRPIRIYAHTNAPSPRGLAGTPYVEGVCALGAVPGRIAYLVGGPPPPFIPGGTHPVDKYLSMVSESWCALAESQSHSNWESGGYPNPNLAKSIIDHPLTSHTEILRHPIMWWESAQISTSRLCCANLVLLVASGSTLFQGGGVAAFSLVGGVVVVMTLPYYWG